MKSIIICVPYYFAMTRSSDVSLKGEKESYLIAKRQETGKTPHSD